MKKMFPLLGLCAMMCIPMTVTAADCSCTKESCACKDACVCTNCKCDKEVCKAKESKEKKAGKEKKKGKSKKSAEAPCGPSCGCHK